VDGGIERFTRTYATVPQPWEEFVAFAWERPGVNLPTGLPVAIIGSSVSFVRGAVAAALGRPSGLNVLAVTVADASAINVNQLVNIQYRYSMVIIAGGAFGMSSGYFGNWVLLRYKAENTLYFPSPVSNSSGNGYRAYGNVYVQFIGRMVNRAPKGFIVAGRVRHSYFRSTNVIADWNPPQPFAIYDQTGGETNIITATTYPSFLQYEEMARSNTWVLATPPLLQRWKGNIWEVITTEVKLQ